MFWTMALRNRCALADGFGYRAGLVFILLSSFSSVGSAIEFQLTLLSSSINDSQIPALVDGDNVVWIGRQSGQGAVYRYQISTGVRSMLTPPSANLSDIAIDGSHVLWENGGIYLYDLSTGITVNLSSEPRSRTPHASGNNIVWLEGRAQDTQARIMYYNLATSTTQQLVGYGNRDDLRISGNDIVWDGRVGSAPETSEIFHYSLQTAVTTRITNNAIPDVYPEVSQGNVVWQTFDVENSAEIFHRNLQTGVTERLTNNSSADHLPMISGNNIVWNSAYAGGIATNIAYHDLSTGITTLLTHATAPPETYGVPKVEGSSVVWLGQNDFGTLHEEIFFHNLADGVTSPVTSDNFRDELPQVSGFNVVFRRERTPNSNLWDIYLATPVPEPSVMVLMWTAGAIILARAIPKA